MFDETLVIGGYVLTNRSKTLGNAYVACDLWQNISMVLELVNIGERAAFLGTCMYRLRDDHASIILTGFTQARDGIAGGNIGLFQTASGTYVSVGAIRHNPIYGPDTDGNPNTNYEKFTPSVEIGINRDIFMKRTR